MLVSQGFSLASVERGAVLIESAGEPVTGLSRTLDDPGVSPGKTMLVSQGFSVSPAEQRDVIIKSEGDPSDRRDPFRLRCPTPLRRASCGTLNPQGQPGLG